LETLEKLHCFARDHLFKEKKLRNKKKKKKQKNLYSFMSLVFYEPRMFLFLIINFCPLFFIIIMIMIMMIIIIT